MPHFATRNVNSAFRRMVNNIEQRDINYYSLSTEVSRNGDVVYWDAPVVLEYTRPLERVLFNRARDANPYFHLYEAMWMLAGRNDLAPLQYYVSTFNNYSDDGITLNGAYGHRWRHAVLNEEDITGWHPHEEVDQLSIIIDHLKHNPTSRRAVLHMSNVKDDTLKMDTTKDQCCNLNCVFKMSPGGVEDIKPKLNIAVFNRSNDTILGALGANYVHFSFLLEYMAACIGVDVGKYYQISSNMHVYTDPKLWKPKLWLADDTPDYYHTDSQGAQGATLFPLVKDPATFDTEVVDFVERHRGDSLAGNYSEPFFGEVAQPMCIAFHHHKRRDYASAIAVVKTVAAEDWRIAGLNWLLKRKEMWEQRK